MNFSPKIKSLTCVSSSIPWLAIVALLLLSSKAIDRASAEEEVLTCPLPHIVAVRFSGEELLTTTVDQWRDKILSTRTSELTETPIPDFQLGDSTIYLPAASFDRVTISQDGTKANCYYTIAGTGWILLQSQAGNCRPVSGFRVERQSAEASCRRSYRRCKFLCE